MDFKEFNLCLKSNPVIIELIELIFSLVSPLNDILSITTEFIVRQLKPTDEIRKVKNPNLNKGYIYSILYFFEKEKNILQRNLKIDNPAEELDKYTELLSERVVVNDKSSKDTIFNYQLKAKENSFKVNDLMNNKEKNDNEVETIRSNLIFDMPLDDNSLLQLENFYKEKNLNLSSLIIDEPQNEVNDSSLYLEYFRLSKKKRELFFLKDDNYLIKPRKIYENYLKFKGISINLPNINKMLSELLINLTSDFNKFQLSENASPEMPTYYFSERGVCLEKEIKKIEISNDYIENKIEENCNLSYMKFIDGNIRVIYKKDKKQSIVEMIFRKNIIEIKKLDMYNELFGYIIRESKITHYFFFMDMVQRNKMDLVLSPYLLQNKIIKEYFFKIEKSNEEVKEIKSKFIGKLIHLIEGKFDLTEKLLNFYNIVYCYMGLGNVFKDLKI